MGTTQHKVYNLIVLDESGSMGDIKKPTIRGFNEIVQTIKEVEQKFSEQKHYISLISFGGTSINELLWQKEVGLLQEIDEDKYNPHSSTPLYDAIGKGLSKLKEELAAEKSYNVLVTILTDGEENSSHDYNSDMIKKMIDELKRQSWTFTYIGANHDVEKTAMSISITNTLKFEANETDINKMFEKEKKARNRMASMTRVCMKMSEPANSIAFNENFYKEDDDQTAKQD